MSEPTVHPVDCTTSIEVAPIYANTFNLVLVMVGTVP